MKNRYFIKKSIVGLLPLTLSMVALFGINSQKANETEAYSSASLPTAIDLNDNTDSQIRQYYSGLNSLSKSEKQGTNLLKNLKGILKNGQKYYKYDDTNNVWKIYEITDRDWVKSPASKISTYDPSTNKISKYSYGSSASNPGSNPYIHAFYVDRNFDNPMTAWGNHEQKYGGINREHLWAKSRGFEAAGGAGARGDPMHLVASDGISNRIHNAYSFGYVDKTKTSDLEIPSPDYAKGNCFGISKTLGSGKVFEPQDSDKGDVARALFYMVARYNALDGDTQIDQDNPNLHLGNYTWDGKAASYNSTATNPGEYGILSDLLEWNRIDPPDEYEIHRNNLLFNNFTNNRNPFIDFPYWAEIAFGGSSRVANPQTDKINSTLPNATVLSISITKNPAKTKYVEGEKFDPTGMVVEASYSDGSSNKVTDYTYSPTSALTSSNTVITISYEGKTTTLPISVVKVNSIEIAQQPTKTNYAEGEKFDPTGMVVKANFSDSTSSIITDYTFTPSNSLKVENDTITISYKGKTALVHISVDSSVKVTGITIFAGPDNTYYKEGDLFDPTGMVVNVLYSDGTQKTTTNYDYPTEPLAAGEQLITITFGDFTAETKIFVESSISTEKTISLGLADQNFENKQVVETILGEDDFRIDFFRGNNGNSPTYYDSTEAVSVYIGNNFTVSGKYKITSIQLVVSTSKDSNNNFSTDKPTFDLNAHSWTGRADDVTFTLNGDKGSSKISQINITYDTAEEAVVEDEYTILDWIVEHWVYIAIAVASVILLAVIIGAIAKGKKKKAKKLVKKVVKTGVKSSKKSNNSRRK